MHKLGNIVKKGMHSMEGIKPLLLKVWGGNYPYNTPSLCIQRGDKSDDFSFYISGAGFYQDLTRISVKWIFDSEPNVTYRSSNINISKNGKILFLDDFMNPKDGFKIEKIEFIEQLQQSNKVNVRISDKYDSNDLSFSLKGSTKAINFVIPIEYKNNLISEIKSQRDELTNILKSHQITDEEKQDIIRKIRDMAFMGYSVSDVDSIVFKKDSYGEDFYGLLLDSNGIELYKMSNLRIPSLYEKYYFEIAKKLKSYQMTDEEGKYVIEKISGAFSSYSDYSTSDIDSIVIKKDSYWGYFYALLIDFNGKELKKMERLKIPSLYEKYKIELKSKKETIYKLMDKYKLDIKSKDYVYEKIEPDRVGLIAECNIFDIDSISIVPFYQSTVTVNFYNVTADKIGFF